MEAREGLAAGRSGLGMPERVSGETVSRRLAAVKHAALGALEARSLHARCKTGMSTWRGSRAAERDKPC